MNKAQHYTVHRIPKKNGKFRQICEPSQLLKVVQYQILTRVLNQIAVSDYVWAFEPGKSIPQMAALHTNKDLVLSFDIKDFFTSIKNDLILEVLAQYGITDRAAQLLSELVTYKYYLPQGGITSPKISNLVSCHTFGPELNELAANLKVSLTIYADDITISLNYDDVNYEGLGGLTRENLQNVLKRKVSEIVSSWGFRIQSKKTKVMYKSVRQYVCGAVVNQKVNLQRSQREKLRAVVYNVITQGVESQADKAGQSAEKFLSTLKGKLNWYKQLNPERADKLITKLNDFLNSLPTSEQIQIPIEGAANV